MTGELSGRRVLVTGGSKGIGRAVSQGLAARGAQVAVVARDRTAMEATLAELPGEGHLAIELDVTDECRWPRALQALPDPRLDGLVIAAGALGPIGAIDAIKPVDFRRAWEVNLHGTFLALHHSMGLLVASGRGAVVTFSGGGATGPLPRYDAYAASKAAVVRLSENVATDARGRGVTVNAVAPGFVATDIHEGTLTAGPEAAGSAYYDRTREELAEGGVPPDLAAELVCFLISSEAREISGKLISAQWDPWRTSAFRHRLASEADLATLRRIDGQFFSKGT